MRDVVKIVFRILLPSEISLSFDAPNFLLSTVMGSSFKVNPFFRLLTVILVSIS
jgi:hypothetical protein